MTGVRVIGIDPGPTPGVVALDLELDEEGPFEISGVDVVQCSARALWPVLEALVPHPLGIPAVMAVERFVVRGRVNAAQAVTRDQVAELARTYPGIYQRPAVAVKAWATDVRLEAAELYDAVAGMRHARDAARHALYAAVHDAGLPDPLSNRSRKTS